MSVAIASPPVTGFQPLAVRPRAYVSKVDVVLGNPRYDCRFQGICRIDALPRPKEVVLPACPQAAPPLRGRLTVWPDRRTALLLVSYRDCRSALTPTERGACIQLWLPLPLGPTDAGRHDPGYLLPGRYPVSRAGAYAYILLPWREGAPPAILQPDNPTS